MTIKLERAQTEFVTPEGLLSFCYLFAGQAQPSFSAGSFAYKTEIGWDPKQILPNDPMVAAISLVAQTFDQSVISMPDGTKTPGWHRHIYGRDGKLRFLHETKRDASKYPYYEGKLFTGFSAVWNAKSLKMPDNFDLSQPENRNKFDMALNAQAPGAYRFANPNNQMDLTLIEAENNKRLFQGLPAHKESDYAKVLLPVAPHEIWPGCYGRVSGRAYWSANGKPPTVGLALTHVLLTRQGDRIVGGESSPDSSFSAFAPSTDLAPAPSFALAAPPAPQAPLPSVDPFAGLV